MTTGRARNALLALGSLVLTACSSEAPPPITPLAKPAAGSSVQTTERDHVSIGAAATKWLPRDAVAAVHVSSPAMVLYRIVQAGKPLVPGIELFVNDAIVLSPLGLRKKSLPIPVSTGLPR